MPGHRPVSNLRWTLGDHHHPGDAAGPLPAVGVRPGEALLTPGSEMQGELAPQRPTRLDVQRAIDRLVRDLHLLIVGVREPQPARDLLRRVILPEPLDHKLTQLATELELRRSRRLARSQVARSAACAR